MLAKAIVGRVRMQFAESSSGAAIAQNRRFKSIIQDRTLITALPANRSLGSLQAYVPDAAVNDELFVFFAGSWASCHNYSQLLETIASRMMTLCLPYDNVEALGVLCYGKEPSCWLENRVEAFNGSFSGIPGNNQVARLKSALEYLARHNGTAWKKFLGPSGPKFDAIRFGGHSQGAGAAATMGYFEKVARVVQFSGPCDSPPWYRDFTAKTPADRFYGATSVFDVMCDYEGRQRPAWEAEGMFAQVKEPLVVNSHYADSVQVPLKLAAGASQGVITGIRPPTCTSPFCVKDAHDSIALNTWDGTREDGSPTRAPYADGLWQALVGV